MAEKTLIQNMITRLGQSQDERLPPELAADFVQVDERSPADQLALASKLARQLRYYATGPERPNGHWGAFFPEADEGALLARDDGSVPPHLGLLGAFYALYEAPRAAANTLTGRHRDFQFQRVLGFVPTEPRPDHAHLVLELKKGAAPLAVTPAHRFTAGKDAGGLPLVYQPVRETVVGQGRVADLRSVFRDDEGVRFAPIANSADGLGGKPLPESPHWPAFGAADRPSAPLGFALASPVLAMAEGRRRVGVDLELAAAPAGLDGASIAECLVAYLSGPMGWLGPYTVTGKLSGKMLSLDVALAEGDPAVVDYAPAIHGLALAATGPVVQFVLDRAARYGDLAGLPLAAATLRVEVDGVTHLQLENDNGALNPKKAFQPFGPQPVKGSRFLVGCSEALSKRLTDLRLRLSWQGAPGNLVAHYSDYKNKIQMSNGVSATLVYQDRSGQQKQTTLDLMARDADGASLLSPSAPSPGPIQVKGGDGLLFGLLSGGSALSRWLGRRMQLAQPMYQRAVVPPPTAPSGFVGIGLIDDFLHADYRRESVEHAVKQDKIVLNEPYTPTVQSISLAYAAHSDTVALANPTLAGFANLDVQFFHLGAFGQRREHAFVRHQLAYVADKGVNLLPAYPDEGEFLIGLTGLAAGDGVSLLMQVAEGSADPDATPGTVRWAVLCDNYWRPVADRELTLETTRSLKTSGLVAIVLPAEATTDNTWMPAGRVWIKGSLAASTAAACRLLAVAANAVEVRFVDAGNSASHLASALPPGSIGKMLEPPPLLKGVSQPYASFGGRLRESETMLARRAAERLRHRQRCVTAWDYERILLEAFPGVHKVKCIPHASDTSWLAPGHLTLVAIPDLRNRNAVNPLQPKVDLDTLDRMAATASRWAGPQVAVHVRNPAYQRVRLDFKVRFKEGYPYNYYRQQLHQAIVEALSPWAFDAARPLDFGGRLYRSVLLDFIEELPYVDFVSDFRFGLAASGSGVAADVAELAADRPDAILVSDERHAIAEITD